MIDVTFFLYLIIPFFLSVASFYLFRRFVSGVSFSQAFGASAVGFGISTFLLVIAFVVSFGSQTSDTQVINGEVVDRKRIHDHYLRPYDCNCRNVTSCSGSGSSRSCTSTRVCDTCYEDRYTVTWRAFANIGSSTIEHYDRSSRSVYSSPDPQRYLDIVIGEPFSLTDSYTNYIRAVPDSLFRPAQESLKAQYAGRIPAYPDDIFDFYRINRFVPVGVNVPNAEDWNKAISEATKVVGPAKQANIVVVLTNIDDPNYFYALQDAWVNGKKNDVVVVIGAPNFPNAASWVNVMALTNDNVFQIKLRDRMLALETLTPESVVGGIKQEILSSYSRKQMSDFKYLEAEISPPTWVMVLLTIINIFAYAGFWYYNLTHRSGGSYNRYGVPRMHLDAIRNANKWRKR